MSEGVVVPERRPRYHRGSLIGRHLGGKYELLRVLGQGGMGTVYAARDLRTGKAVAVKWLDVPGKRPRAAALARFAQEARIASSLASPHIAPALDIDRDPEFDAPFL